MLLQYSLYFLIICSHLFVDALWLPPTISKKSSLPWISELINTIRVNNWLAFNISPKYFLSGVESFGGIGFSSYINLLDNLMLIPEINTSLKNNSDFSSTYAFRYSYSQDKSIDLYYSNAAGIQDIGQFLQDKKSRVGIKLNFIY